MTWKPEIPIADNLAGAYASRPASGTAVGQRYSPTDGGPEFEWDGTLWRPCLGTTLGYEPPSSGWTVIDGGLGADGSFSNGVYELASTSGGSSNGVALAVRSLPGSTFDVRVRLRPIMSLRNSGGGSGTFASGLVLRDGSSGNFQWVHFVANSAKTKQINVATYSNPTTWLATQLSQDVTQNADDSSLWIRAVDTLTERTYYISNDGIRWWSFYSINTASKYPASATQFGLGHQLYIPSGTGAWDSGVRCESLHAA